MTNLSAADECPVERCENCGHAVQLWTFPATGRTVLRELNDAWDMPTPERPWILVHTPQACRAYRRGKRRPERVLPQSVPASLRADRGGDDDER